MIIIWGVSLLESFNCFYWPFTQVSIAVNHHVSSCVCVCVNVGEIQELYEGSASHPSIVVVAPEDNKEDMLPAVLRHRHTVPSLNISALPPNVVHTMRPPKVIAPEKNNEEDSLPAVLRHRQTDPTLKISTFPPNVVHTARPPPKKLS